MQVLVQHCLLLHIIISVQHAWGSERLEISWAHNIFAQKCHHQMGLISLPILTHYRSLVKCQKIVFSEEIYHFIFAWCKFCSVDMMWIIWNSSGYHHVANESTLYMKNIYGIAFLDKLYWLQKSKCITQL